MRGKSGRRRMGRMHDCGGGRVRRPLRRPPAEPLVPKLTRADLDAVFVRRGKAEHKSMPAVIDLLNKRWGRGKEKGAA